MSTWPEHRLAHIDVFTCRADTDPRQAIEPILSVLGGQVTRSQAVPQLSPNALLEADNTNLDKQLA